MNQHYGVVARGFHWAMAALVLLALAVGEVMTDLPVSPRRLEIYSYHKWVGMTVLGLLLLRLLWRTTHRPPALPGSIPLWQQQVAHVTHWLLYLLMFVVPLSGWLMSSAKGFPVVYLGIWQLPDLVTKDKALGHTLENVHAVLANGLLVLVVLHVAAALKHHFIDRDDVLARMVPHLRRKG